MITKASTLLLIVGIAMAGCTRAAPGPSVVLYASADEYLAREVVAAFERETGIAVRMVTDSEAQKTTGLVSRLRAEADHPQADVFWSSEVFMTIDLAAEGVLVPHESPAVADWPEAFRDRERRWHGFAARARVIVYSPQRVAPEDRPTTWMDLTDARWAGRVVMADPRFGTTGGHLGAMKAYWDGKFGSPAYYDAFLMGLADNETRLLAGGNAGVVQAVANGEADLGLTDTDDVRAAQRRGLEVEMIYPRHWTDDGTPGAGTLLIPNTVALVRGGPNPDAAARLADFLLAPATERLIAGTVSGNLPLGPTLADAFPELAVPDPLAVDLRRAAAARERAVEMAMRRLDPRRRSAPEPTGDAR